jgi:hypothetical protein
LQKAVEEAMIAIEESDWDQARGRVAQAKKMLANACNGPLQDLAPDAQGRRQMEHVSGMVSCPCNSACSAVPHVRASEHTQSVLLELGRVFVDVERHALENGVHLLQQRMDCIS